MQTNATTDIKALFFSPIRDNRQIMALVFVSFLLIFVPQQQPNDWDLNTRGFWSDIPNTYLDMNRVYPPWGLILMIPYYLMRAEGARVCSGLVIGLLAARRGWSLSKFFAVISSPYFMWTLIKSNMDILVLVLPIVLWELAVGERWQGIGWGLALSLSLLKPQGAIFIWLYWIWTSRKRLKELVVPFSIVACIVVPISLVGSPPLIIQWLNNVEHPSLRNEMWWAVNNVSLTTRFSFAGAVSILLILVLVFVLLAKLRKITWTRDHSLSGLLFASMFLSLYTSQQSVSSALAFVPSWAAVGVQFLNLGVGAYAPRYVQDIPVDVLALAFVSLIMFVPMGNTKERRSYEDQPRRESSTG